MFDRPSAVGFLRSDISGCQQSWEENHIRSTAAKFGYDLRKTIVFGAGTDRPVHRLRVSITRLKVDAVIVPSLAHLGGTVPTEVGSVAAVITVWPEEIHHRTVAAQAVCERNGQ
ncbi:hypothetical protein JK358_24520 [Nocardia sp. 2]|uniref:Uncharacterized protein n=1 Tax=Nocardia acididurans TaxID=2802282 RepID=A0ABS1MBV1_9NOCA|nr:hypothetical protein [Nocardia acididurans]MBL1077575.1 hypothetical protein [Nocardia acididurans]